MASDVSEKVELKIEARATTDDRLAATDRSLLLAAFALDLAIWQRAA